MNRSKLEREVRTQIAQFGNALTRPIVVFDKGWAEILPAWLKNRITFERLVQLMKHEKGKATSAEAVAYLHTASLAQPLTDEWTAIFCWLVGRYAREQGKTFPEDIVPAHLTAEQTRLLDDLLAWLWRRTANACPRRTTSREISVREGQYSLFPDA